VADKAVETSGFKALKIYFDAKRPETYALREAERSVRRHPGPHRAGAGGYGSGHQFRGHLALLAGLMCSTSSERNIEQIVATLSQQSTWSHVVELLPLKDSLQRDFYAEMCRLENWSVRQRSGQRRRA
jgi:hypothetical protein